MVIGLNPINRKPFGLLPKVGGISFHPIIHLSTHSFRIILLPPLLTVFNCPLDMYRLMVERDNPVNRVTSDIENQTWFNGLSNFFSMRSN
jgi:hypothetical protein